jgi:hypothetical protein
MSHPKPSKIPLIAFVIAALASANAAVIEEFVAHHSLAGFVLAWTTGIWMTNVVYLYLRYRDERKWWHREEDWVRRYAPRTAAKS